MKRNREYMLGEAALLRDLLFQRTFRLSCGAFEKLLGKVSFYLRRQEEFAVRSSRSAISPRTRLIATLRCLAGDSCLDICLAYGIAHGTCVKQ
jgi:hypothetical protein